MASGTPTEAAAAPAAAASARRPRALQALPTFQPDLYQRGWSSTAHPTLPLLATAHNKSVTVFSLVNFAKHSALTGGHSRSVRTATWKPGLPPHKLCLVTGSFDSTAGLWRWEQGAGSEVDVGRQVQRQRGVESDGDDDKDDPDSWEFTLVLEGQEHEIKSVAFSPSGQYLATCSRDKSVWIWEDVGASEDDDEWETVAVLNEHDGDVKCVAWCPDVPGRRSGIGSGIGASSRRYGLDILASTSYDNTVRLWREDADAEWVCVAVLEGHEGTVWGAQWESDPHRTRFPRLLTWSADQTLRVWTLQEDDTDGRGDNRGDNNGSTWSSAIPNTMRRSLREEWSCTAILPRAHSRDIYSAAWSASTGLVASTGSDGVIALYAEDDDDDDSQEASSVAEAAAELDGDDHVATGPAASGHSHNPSHDHNHDHHDTPNSPSPKKWRVLATVPNAHGPYEVNNIIWCRRFDAGASQKGVEEMLVSTGDDGLVRPWQMVS